MNEEIKKGVTARLEMEVGKLRDEDLLDPNPDIHALFCHYNELYFGNALGACTVDWSSKRMTLRLPLYEIGWLCYTPFRTIIKVSFK